MTESSDHEEHSFLAKIAIFRELKARAPYYLDDWRQGIHPRVISSILFMIFSSIGPAITFGAVLGDRTSLTLGVVEVLLSTALCGGIYSLFSGQPLIIVGAFPSV